jgi:hypothetical protein
MSEPRRWILLDALLAWGIVFAIGYVVLKIAALILSAPL